jgi:hypothetical protein
MNLELAVRVAQELAARRALGAAFEAERRRKRCPRVERRKNELAIFSYQLEKEARDVDRP